MANAIIGTRGRKRDKAPNWGRKGPHVAAVRTATTVAACASTKFRRRQQRPAGATGKASSASRAHTLACCVRCQRRHFQQGHARLAFCLPSVCSRFGRRLGSSAVQASRSCAARRLFWQRRLRVSTSCRRLATTFVGALPRFCRVFCRSYPPCTLVSALMCSWSRVASCTGS